MKTAEQRLTLPELNRMEFSSLHILRRVNIETVWGLLEHCPILILAQGSTLLNKGEANQTMYMVLSGELNIHISSTDDQPDATLLSGQTVGELSVIDNSPASAYVVAKTPARLLSIDEATFWRLIEVSHGFATNLLILMASRLRANNSAIVQGLNMRLQLEHEATVDGLTGLRNRRWLDKNLVRMVKRHAFSHKPFCVIMIDIDHFKRFNDDYGHSAGDSVLAKVAQTVMEGLRPTDLASRYGGEELCIMLPDTDLEGARIAADRIRLSVANTRVFRADGTKLPAVTISLGAADLQSEDTPESVVNRADQALYRAKENGRNRVEISR